MKSEHIRGAIYNYSPSNGDTFENYIFPKDVWLFILSLVEYINDFSNLSIASKPLSFLAKELMWKSSIVKFEPIPNESSLEDNFGDFKLIHVEKEIYSKNSESKEISKIAGSLEGNQESIRGFYLRIEHDSNYVNPNDFSCIKKSLTSILDRLFRISPYFLQFKSLIGLPLFLSTSKNENKMVKVILGV
jgi:hypothetical protein